jgi:hypothetical protein
MARENKAYCFPEKFTPLMKNTYRVSAVYRWRVMQKQAADKELIYIGEGEDLLQRIQRVLTPPRDAKNSNTNRRLHDLFLKYVAEGRTVALEVADVDPFEVTAPDPGRTYEVRLGRETMGDRFKRRAIENLLLALAQKAEHVELLNIFIDPVEKAREALSKLPPRVIREMAKKHGLL